MKYTAEIVERKLPQAGQFWKHAGLQSVFLRIPDHYGYRILPDCGDNFFSVKVCGGIDLLDSGDIVSTSKLETDILLLDPVQPIKFCVI